MPHNQQNFYELKLENDRLLEVPEFVKFCVDHQKKDILLQVNNEAHCLTYCGVYKILDQFKFNSVEIHTANILEKHNDYVIKSNTCFFWFTNIKNFDFSYDYTWNQEKLFGFFYGRPNAARLGIALHMLKYHEKISQIRIKLDFDSIDTRKLFDLERLFAWQPESINRINDLNNSKYIGSQDYLKGNYDWSNPLNYLYKNFLIDLVSEPVCYGTTFYPTEKIVRSMLCRRPFIVMSSKNYLEYLRQMGFYTFNEFWDEDYDGFDGQNRYLKILKLIDTIASQPKNKLLDLYYAMTFQLEHNYKLVTEKLYKKDIVLVD